MMKLMPPAEDLHRASFIPLLCAFALLTAALVFYALTAAFAWDEGFHILTAQLIKHGKRPYLDFVFSQTPLNAWWNAAWMALFGESWRISHAVAALCSAGAMMLTSGFILTRFPVNAWRLPGALLASVLVGLNVLVFRFGGIAQPYGFCLLTIVIAWRLTLRSVDRNDVLLPALAGLFTGLAAASSLLTAPVSPVLLLWMLVYNRAGRRPAKFAAFIGGVAVAFAPVLWLWIQSPRHVVFGIIDYNLLYRQADWPHATQQNLEVLMSWIDSGQAVLLILLAAGGLIFTRFRSQWEARAKAEFYLCGWLSLTIFVYLSSSVRPAFERYYVFAVPFLSVLAIAGLSAAASKLYKPDRPRIPALLLGFLIAFGLGKTLYDERDATTWSDMQKVADKVTAVTTPEQTLYADEETYFLTRHTPPSGMEMQNSHKFNFSPADDALLHLIPQTELDRRVKSGYFHTLETCQDDDFLKAHGYVNLYLKSTETQGCKVFWDFNANIR
jgi:4-amino-4-deoxy-L-arabinose transferase-like glycosyltransferase